MTDERKKKILVIEDVHYLRNDVLEMLRFEGYEVAGAENGRVGVEVAREFMPDLIVCDIMMPELSGYEVLEVLRGDIKTAVIPFIFLTAKTDRVDVRHGMGLGADDYLTKPFLSSELLETIRARLEKRAVINAEAGERVRKVTENITTSLPHELRTPLNTIIGFSDMLIIEAGSLKPDQIAEWAQHINDGALRLYRLVENFLTYVRIEALTQDEVRQKMMQDRSTDRAGTVIEFQAIHRAQQVQREDDLKVEIDAQVTVRMAETDLTKIVDEMLDNAFKFSQPGQPVTLSASVDADHLVMRFEDLGRGMKPEEIANIGAYMQFDRIVHEQQGTGLGLVIAKRLVELHGGSLEIESVPEEWTRVTVRLPLVPEAEGAG